MFDKNRLGENTAGYATNEYFEATAHLGFYFNTNDLTGKSFDYSRAEKVYLDITNPFDAGSLEGLANFIEYNTTNDTPDAMAAGALAILKDHGYDGIVFNDEEFGGQTWVAFEPEQIKRIDNASPTADPDIRYSDRDYTYQDFISKPDMKLTTLTGNIPGNRADAVVQAKKNATKVGKFNPKDGSISVHVNDINKDVVIGTNGLKHGLDRRFRDNALVTLYAGDIIKNSIQVNELTPSKREADSSYVLVGAANTPDGGLYIVRSVVNSFSNELASMDVLYAMSAKKGTAALNAPRVSTPSYRSTISIAELLDFVNQYFPDVLPEDV